MFCSGSLDSIPLIPSDFYCSLRKPRWASRAKRIEGNESLCFVACAGAPRRNPTCIQHLTTMQMTISQNIQGISQRREDLLHYCSPTLHLFELRVPNKLHIYEASSGSKRRLEFRKEEKRGKKEKSERPHLLLPVLFCRTSPEGSLSSKRPAPLQVHPRSPQPNCMKMDTRTSLMKTPSLSQERPNGLQLISWVYCAFQ